ncbi:hypothetical protein V7S43_013207 [Phytophthora oleae]|uniref:Uncharacterized protein n=1 Tax=Phytophthora oleae TaxID=2107226 RepID=A0ABD3F8T3_9STRA
MRKDTSRHLVTARESTVSNDSETRIAIQNWIYQAVSEGETHVSVISAAWTVVFRPHDETVRRETQRSRDERVLQPPVVLSILEIGVRRLLDAVILSVEEAPRETH